jgi:hypothetical protein
LIVSIETLGIAFVRVCLTTKPKLHEKKPNHKADPFDEKQNAQSEGMGVF